MKFPESAPSFSKSISPLRFKVLIGCFVSAVHLNTSNVLTVHPVYESWWHISWAGRGGAGRSVNILQGRKPRKRHWEVGCMIFPFPIFSFLILENRYPVIPSWRIFVSFIYSFWLCWALASAGPSPVVKKRGPFLATSTRSSHCSGHPCRLRQGSQGRVAQ